jgi:uncharacterized protein (UPF0548 family)
MLRLTEPSDAELERLLETARRSDLTYDETGATKGGDLPAGYRLARYDRRLGTGDVTFARAIHALKEWRTHLGAGAHVYPTGVRVEDDATVLFVLRAFGVWTIAPCRVVYVVEEPARFGFAYGSLPGHPECGEVAITVVRHDEGAVNARVESFSRTVDPFARAILPLARGLQERVTRRYLEALAAATA